MRITSLSLGRSAGLITAIGFGICGVFFAIAGEPRLLVIGSYRMGFATTPGQTDVTLSVGIDYDLPRRGLSQILGRLFGRSYAKWCTKKLVQDGSVGIGPTNSSARLVTPKRQGVPYP